MHDVEAQLVDFIDDDKTKTKFDKKISLLRQGRAIYSRTTQIYQ